MGRLSENSGLARDPEWRALVLRWSVVALVVHGLAAIFSAGFYHADEHFQILEFINARLGRSPLSDLPIEYSRMIRPWLQPCLYGVILRGMELLGIRDPFLWAGACRAFSSLVGLLSSLGLLLCAWQFIPSRVGRRVAAVATALLWYLPAFHARHSSENLGGSVFFLGLSLILLLREPERIPRGVAFWGGLLLGLGFELRYQVGFMVLGAGLWFALIARARVFRELVPMAGGVCLAVALGTCLDRWGYGQWTFAPWNYVNFNLVQNHVADTDTNPLWDFFRRAATETWPPLGILALAAFVVAWVRHPKNLLTWSMVPLFLVHHAIGHKELRFLFPLAHAGPLMLALALERRAPWPGWARVFGWGLAGIDGMALFFQSLLPAWMPIRLYSFLYHYEPRPVRLGIVGEGPYHILGNPLHFYRPEDLEQVTEPDFTQLGFWIQRSSHDQPVLVLRNGFELPWDMPGRESCVARFRTLPRFLDQPELKHALENVKNWTVFECRDTL